VGEVTDEKRADRQRFLLVSSPITTPRVSGDVIHAAAWSESPKILDCQVLGGPMGVILRFPSKTWKSINVVW
jgi:hypothetical protein